MSEWRIYYGDGSVVSGTSEDEWRAAPDDGVQVVALMEPYPDLPDGQPQRPWIGVDDRQLWTGTSEYDPFDWGVKYGSSVPDAEYFAIWERAAYGDH